MAMNEENPKSKYYSWKDIKLIVSKKVETVNKSNNLIQWTKEKLKCQKHLWKLVISFYLAKRIRKNLPTLAGIGE
jgi:hypothetical protein